MSELHTRFYTGSKIRMVMNDGSVIIAKYKETLGKKKIRTDKGDINIIDCRSINYYKPLPHEHV